MQLVISSAIAFLLFFSSSQESFAEILELRSLPLRSCRNEVLALLDQNAEWRPASQRWHREIHLMPTDLYKTSTRRVGHWIKIAFAPSNVTTVRFESPQEIRIFAFRGETACQKEESRAPRNIRKLASPERDILSDKVLAALLRKHRRGILYAWSPHMPVSFYGLPRIASAANTLGMKVFFVMDPHADEAEARLEATKHGLPASALTRMESFELFERGLPNHFPSILVFDRGRIVGNPIPGVKETSAYITMIREELGRPW